MEDSSDPCRAGLRHDCAGILFGIAGVHDHWLPFLSSQSELRSECGKLRVARRILVMVVESAFAYRDRPEPEKLPQSREVVRCIEDSSIVRVDAGGGEHEAAIFVAKLHRDHGRGERLTDTDNPLRARRAGARDYGVAVAGERRVREVGVAVDEDVRAPVLRGHLRSIQRRIGAAT